MWDTPSYRLSPSPGRGIGLFATRDIALGELVIAEPPLVTALGPAEINRAVANLSAEDKATFYAFTDVWSPACPTPVTIFRTNALPLGPQPARGGIFPFCCRMNHSCVPNVYHCWNGATGCEMIHASTDIPMGTEFFTSYLENEKSRAERLARLSSAFRFRCQCPACNGPPDPVSDIRRERISALDDLILETAPRNPAGALRYVHERLRLLDEEGMLELSERARTHYDAFQACIVVSDWEKARRHIGQAYAYRFLCQGADSEETQHQYGLYRYPRGHPAAGMLGKSMGLPEMCDGCGQEVEGSGGKKGKAAKRVMAMSCEGCKCASYCSDACRIAHLPRHLPVCDILRGTGMMALMREGRWEVHG